MKNCMKKFALFLIISMFAVLSFNKTYAAFPVKEKITKTTMVKDNTESGKITVQESKEVAKSELEAAASAAAGGGGGKQVIAAILAFFLGSLGIHDFVLGNMTKGLMHLGLFALGIALMVIGLSGYVAGAGLSVPTLAIIGYLVLVGNSIWAFVDFIRILIGKYPGI